jgi:hypothetical protein
MPATIVMLNAFSGRCRTDSKFCSIVFDIACVRRFAVAIPPYDLRTSAGAISLDANVLTSTAFGITIGVNACNYRYAECFQQQVENSIKVLFVQIV